LAESRREDEGLDELDEDLGVGGEEDLYELEDEDHSLRGRLSKAGEDAIGDVAQALLENPILNSALSTALGAGERAMQAQRSAMEALNLPAASDIDRLERRLRAISDRVEELEDRLDDLGADVAALRRQATKGE
jgi:septal ring factor EnvC (AmiA/AmiB activator)